MKKFEPTKIELSIPVEMQMLADLLDMTPEDLIVGFMRDLCSMERSGGSDERQMAKDYFLRRISPCEWMDDFEDMISLMDGFTEMRDSNYPAIVNTEYQAKRREQLKQWYGQWSAKRKSGLKRNRVNG